MFTIDLYTSPVLGFYTSMLWNGFLIGFLITLVKYALKYINS